MISWSYRTNVDNCFDRASCLSGLYEVDQEDVSARLTWLSTDQKWRVTAYGNNLTDDRYITGGTPLVDVAETAGTVYNLPRTYGVEASYTW
jgi:iron complex outermembrane receptor protein